MKLMNSRANDLGKADKKPSSTFSFTRLASCMLERIAVCMQQVEHVLLVVETGVGKTSSVQYLAERTKHKLMVVNMNNQSDVSDLIGGFKPVDLSYVVLPLRSEFEFLFRHTFNATKNESFFSKFSICYNQGNFPVIVKLMLKIVNSVFEKAERNELRNKDLKLIPRWRCLKIKLQKLCNQLNKSINISFAFIPGSLVNCIKFGDWVLLDEINLASAETLECAVNSDKNVKLLGREGPKELQECSNYILTGSVRNNLKDLARIIFIGKFPVLLQGSTSAGKMSLIEYVAKRSGSYCLRINNHEQTDLQEYIGTYAANMSGKAMRQGYWIILDELNLASTEILEALNRVLDDNRELFIPETQAIVKAHPNFMLFATQNPPGALKMAQYIVEIVLFIRQKVEKFKFSIRDILAWANYIVNNNQLSFGEKAIFGLETIFLDALEMLSFESLKKIDELRSQIINEALNQAAKILKKHVTLEDLLEKRGTHVECVSHQKFGIKPFFVPVNTHSSVTADEHFLFDAPITKKNLFRLLSALTLKKPILLEGPPGVGKTSIVESIAQAIGFQIVRINLCEHTDLADLFGTKLPAEDNILYAAKDQESEVVQMGTFVCGDEPLLAALKSKNTWILLDELNLAPQSVLEGLNAILDHRGEVYLPELNKTFTLPEQTRIFACQNPLKQGGGRKGLPQSFLSRFTKVYLRKLTSEDLLHVINQRYESSFLDLKQRFIRSISQANNLGNCNLFDANEALKNNQPLKNCDSSDHTLTFNLALKMVRFSELLDRGLLAMEFGYKGGPYEINLHNILRWCGLLIHPETCYCPQPGKTFVECFDEFLLTIYERMKLVYYQRMRCTADKAFIRNAFDQVFKCDVDHLNSQRCGFVLGNLINQKIYLNGIVISRESANKTQSLHSLQGKQFSPLLLTSQREVLKHIVECVHMEKPVLICGPTDAGKTKVKVQLFKAILGGIEIAWMWRISTIAAIVGCFGDLRGSSNNDCRVIVLVVFVLF
uniref:Midasin n=1 Tax=Glossina palpalis gambiensis TaxID=67801 RepID=A0A1B0BTK7_9MUSC